MRFHEIATLPVEERMIESFSGDHRHAGSLEATPRADAEMLAEPPVLVNAYEHGR